MELLKDKSKDWPAGLAACVILFCLVWQNGAQAASLHYMPKSGSLSCAIPVERLSGVDLPNGFAIIHGDKIVIKAPDDYYGEPSEVLAGHVFKVEIDSNASPFTVSGLAYFNSGPALSRLDPFGRSDLIFTHSGTVQGRIKDFLKDGSLVVSTLGRRSRTVDARSIIYMRSPRAFVFTVKAAGSESPDLIQPFQGRVISGELKPTGAQTIFASRSVINPAGSSDAGYSSLSHFGDATTLPASIHGSEIPFPWRDPASY